MKARLIIEQETQLDILKESRFSLKLYAKKGSLEFSFN